MPPPGRSVLPHRAALLLLEQDKAPYGWAASPRKPQLFVTQVDITKLSHCQSLQQQTPRPDHRPSASCAASIHSKPAASSPPSSSPALSTQTSSSPPLSSAISNPSARLRARRIITLLPWHQPPQSPRSPSLNSPPQTSSRSPNRSTLP